MLAVIEKLLVLQDRDRKITRVRTELASLGPERQAMQLKSQTVHTSLDAAKLKVKQLESDRKRLELEVEAKKQLIDRYSTQQFQTRKNEEYRALAHEITNCKSEIGSLEDQQLALMEQGDQAQAEVTQATQAAEDTRKTTSLQEKALSEREEALKRRLAELEANYEELTAGIEDTFLTRYQRLRKQKGDNAVVGVERCVCGGCHVKLPTQVVISCQVQSELVTCPNCGRILYYAPHMDLAAVE